jgi:hypothetical protein
MELQNKLADIQSKLVAPKNQWNAFGKYKYRSCEDILEAVKPLLKDSTIVLNDEIVMLGDRYYVKATATLKMGSEEISVSAYAREEESKKGMDGSQVTGAASSYARKYALNGLLAIDDSKDSDKTSEAKQTIEVPEALIKQINECASPEGLTALCKKATEGKSQDFKKAVLVYYNIKKEKLGGEV